MMLLLLFLLMSAISLAAPPPTPSVSPVLASPSPSLSPSVSSSPSLSLSPQNPKPARSPREVKAPEVELSSKEIVSGTLAMVHLYLPPGFKKGPIHGEFEGSDLPFFPISENEMGTVLAVPYERKPGPGKVEIKIGEGADAIRLEASLTVTTGDYPSEVLKVDQNKVSPKKKDLARILREQREIKAVYQKVTPTKFWTGPFTLPIHSSVTSPFGSRRVYNGQLKSYHTGLDLKAPMNTPIYSAAPGTVVLAKNLFYTGNTVILDHGFGVMTLYAHMTKLKVKAGDQVGAHQLVGLSGKTGRVNGPHLHWMAIVHHVKVNPMGLVEVLE